MIDKNEAGRFGETGATNDLRIPDAIDDLLPLVYDELRVLAATLVQRRRPFDPTHTTSLVHELYIKLNGRGLAFRDRPHFFCLAARAMRRILIDRTRRRQATKRGGPGLVVSLDDDVAAAGEPADLLAIDAALAKLATFDEQKARIVELRFFAGLSMEDTAEALGLSAATTKREWALARAWLYREVDRA